MKSNNAILGLVAGLALGATLGVLLAPDKGEKTRKKIGSKTKKVKDNLKESFDDFLDTVSEKYGSIKHNGEELLNKEKEELKEKMKKA
ncbi:YtxH domain-containing protein [Gaetbulibacter aquiaggeris]|uniref:YtxH domain-containing protein n=1 Tax=Gaetbulibacter aquiaggeris TaxID=1735373 RepID=A0ABW7MQE8_9FLAO